MAELIDHTFIFTIARMNPPTPGHLLLINELIKVAQSRNVKSVYVLLSSTKDNTDNPLLCKEKKEFLDKMLMNYNKTNVKVNTECATSGSPVTLISKLLNEYKTKNDIDNVKIFMIIGEDRASVLTSLSKSYKRRENVINFEGSALKRMGMNKLKSMNLSGVTSVNKTSISASFIRRLVVEGNNELFNSSYGNLLSEDEKLQLFESIQKEINNTQAKNNSNPKKRRTTNKSTNNPRKKTSKNKAKPNPKSN